MACHAVSDAKRLDKTFYLGYPIHMKRSKEKSDAAYQHRQQETSFL
ncbi:hypothetical protein BSNT_09945 [Bacillus subtilis subsp. natto BEST195]|nr:hypothetical protein BSNT_09945 [Bacillus subtilis subsp. natto BEST195]